MPRLLLCLVLAVVAVGLARKGVATAVVCLMVALVAVVVGGVALRLVVVLACPLLPLSLCLLAMRWAQALPACSSSSCLIAPCVSASSAFPVALRGTGLMLVMAQGPWLISCLIPCSSLVLLRLPPRSRCLVAR